MDGSLAHVPEPLMPRWFRRALVVIASLLMCSCRGAESTANGQETPSSYPSAACESTTCELGNCQRGECESSDGCFHGGCVVEGCPVCQPHLHPGPGDEYLCDGGDRAYSAAVTEDEQGRALVGLEQEDTVAHYTTGDQRVFVTPSNRVCIYAPRFGSVRRVLSPRGATQRTFVDAFGDLAGPAEADLNQPASTTLQNVALVERAGELPPSLYRGRQQLGATVRLRKPADAIAPVPVYANLQLMHAGVMQMDEGPKVAALGIAAATWTGDEEVQVAISGQAASATFDVKQPGLIYETLLPSSPKLRLVKCASTDSAHPGEEVGFTLRFDNVGDAPMTDVVIVDNLTTRLEYVDGSAESSVDADFSTTRNGAGSLVLRWAITDPVEPGEGGVLTFRTRVR